MIMHYIHVYQSSKYCYSETVTFEDILSFRDMTNELRRVFFQPFER